MRKENYDMKKTYFSPNCMVVKLQTRSQMLTVSYSIDLAADDATVFGRKSSGDWDDEEDY